MTLSEYIKKLQEIEANGCGEFEVYHSDWLGCEVPEPDISYICKEVII